MKTPQDPEAAETVQTKEIPAVASVATCSASDFLDASFKIGSEYEQLNHRVDKMMEKRGWKHTCKTPGSIWLWEKTMPDGRVILTDRGTAGMLEEQMCHEDFWQNNSMKTIDENILRGLMDCCFSGPEADLGNVADCDFSSLAPPILVAAATREQFDRFVFRNGLTCSEVRRFREFAPHVQDPPGKILVILPMAYQDDATEKALTAWVDADRYTVNLDAPWPKGSMSALGWTLFWMAFTAIAWTLTIWQFKN